MCARTVDYIIVGQGLAGSCLALQLLSLNKRIVVIDRPDRNAATRVAAGLFNPVTGKSMMKTWMADQLFPYLFDFYQRSERITGSRFFFPMPVYRPFVSIEEQNEWMARSADSSWNDFVEEVLTRPVYTSQVHNPFGGLMLKQSGFIHTHTFTEAVREYVQKAGVVVEENFDEDNVRLEKDQVIYKEWSARRIVWCTGVKLQSSKFFSWLPVRALKGETLSIQTEEQVPVIYNRGVYVVPGIWKVGATYSATDHRQAATPEGRKELTAKLNELIAFPYNIIGQEWGFRPATPDRRPLLGPHPEIEQFIVLNGLGTKGVSLAPYFSGILCAWMEKGYPIDSSLSLSRYKSLYSKSS